LNRQRELTRTIIDSQFYLASPFTRSHHLILKTGMLFSSFANHRFLVPAAATHKVSQPHLLLGPSSAAINASECFALFPAAQNRGACF
jgi:hypothetical protein